MPRIDPPMIRPREHGEIVIGGPSGVPIRLPAGIDGTVLTVSGGSPAWITPPDTYTQIEIDAVVAPLVTVGMEGQVLRTVAGEPVWSDELDAYTRAEADTLLANYSAVGHGHLITDIADLDVQLGERSLVGHQHSSASIGAAPVVHTHVFADITDPPATYAPSPHAHVFADITDPPTLGTAAAMDSTAFATSAQGTKADTAVQPAALSSYLTSDSAPELIRDTMNTALVAGANVTITPNDAGDTVTIAATGGGGGGAAVWGGITGTLTDQTDLNSALSAKSDNTHDHDADYAALVHDHNTLYYTETEVDTLLGGYSTTAHNHDALYYTEAEINTLIAGRQPIIAKGTVDTAEATAAKTVTIAGYTPAVGDLIYLTYTNGQSASAATVSINGGAAITTRIGGINSTQTSHTIAAGGGVLYYYDGTYLHMAGSQYTNEPSVIPSAEITAGTATTGRTITGQRTQEIVVKAQTTVPTAVNASDAVNKEYVDGAFSPLGHNHDANYAAIDHQHAGTASNSIVIGGVLNATWSESVGIGTSATANASAVAVGSGAQASAQSASMGWNALANGGNATAAGALSSAAGAGSVSIGYNSMGWGANSVAVGSNSYADPAGGLALGYNAKSNAAGAIAIGNINNNVANTAAIKTDKLRLVPVTASGPTTIDLARTDGTVKTLGIGATDYLEVNGIAPLVAKRKLSDQTTTVVTAANVTDMFHAAAANTTWAIDFNLWTGCNNTGGLKFAVTYPTGATIRYMSQGMTTAATAMSSSWGTTNALSGTAYNTVNSAAGWLRISVTATVGATAGDIQLQFASGVAAQTSTIFAGSQMIARKV